MKKILKAITLILALVITSTSLFACNDESGLPKNYTKLPDYSGKGKYYEFSACSGPMNGIFTIDGEKVQLGPDQRTVEGYTTFLDAGFNIVYLSGTASDTSPTFEMSECKRAMTAAYEAGAKKIILQDSRIWNLSELGDDIIGTTKGYATFDDLVDQVKIYMSEYIEQDGFYGVTLRDEASAKLEVADRWVYKAVYTAWLELVEERNIQKPIKDYIMIYQNLLPYTSDYTRYGDPGEYETMAEAYTAYIENHFKPTLDGVVDENGEPVQFMTPDIFSIDVYAPRDKGLSPDYFVTFLLLRELCQKYNVRPSFAITSFEMYNGNYRTYRGAYMSEMMLELYSLMGVGYENFMYYTYQPSQSRKSLAEWNEEFCFMTSAGEKTNIYTYGQQLMGWAQKMGEIILNYEYQGAKFYFSELPNYNVGGYLMGNPGNVILADEKKSSEASSLTFDNNKHTFTLLNGVQFTNDALFVTELKDEENNLYMYMLQNVVDPGYGGEVDTSGTVTATFDASYTHVAKIKDGNVSYVPLVDGVYSETLSAGQAVYLVPLK